MMRQTISEFMGCKDWSKAELCDLVDEMNAKIEARDELIRDMLDAKIKDSEAINLATGRRFLFARDEEQIYNWRERMRELGVKEEW